MILEYHQNQKSGKKISIKKNEGSRANKIAESQQ